MNGQQRKMCCPRHDSATDGCGFGGESVCCDDCPHRAAAANGWDAAARWVVRLAENTSPEKAMERIDRYDRFNPYRTTTGVPS